MTEGYPCYAGRFRLGQEFQWTGEARQAWVAFDRIDAIAARVSVNGRDAGFLAWPPYRLEASGLLVPGRNLLEVELATSLHNLLGPTTTAVARRGTLSWTGRGWTSRTGPTITSSCQ